MEQPGIFLPPQPPSKYWPVSNFSLPRKTSVKHASQQQCEQEQPVERRRSSASDYSESSAPSMVEDHESDISVEEDFTYHVTGAELWDSFWHVDTNTSSQPSPSKKHSSAGRRRDSIKMLLPDMKRFRNPFQAPAPEAPKDVAWETEQPLRYDSTDPLDNMSWPLPPVPVTFYERQATDSEAQRPRTAKIPSPKANYSLFPSHQPAADLPVLPQRTTSFSRPQTSASCRAPMQPFSLHSLSADNIASMTKSSSSATLPMLDSRESAPTSPEPRSPSPTGQDGSTTPQAPQPTNFRRRPSLASFRRPSSSKKNNATQDSSVSKRRPPHLSFSPTDDLLSHYQELPPSPAKLPQPHQPHDQTSQPTMQPEPQRDPPPPPPPPPPPAPVLAPPPSLPSIPSSQTVSVFELDSDNESDLSDDDSLTLARRIVRGLGGGHRRQASSYNNSRRKRSASEIRRTARGDDAAQAQLRRARAGTSAAATAASLHGSAGSKSSVATALSVASSAAEKTPPGTSSSSESSAGPLPGSLRGSGFSEGPGDSAFSGTVVEAELEFGSGVGAVPASAGTRPKLRRQRSDLFNRLLGRLSR